MWYVVNIPINLDDLLTSDDSCSDSTSSSSYSSLTDFVLDIQNSDINGETPGWYNPPTPLPYYPPPPPPLSSSSSSYNPPPPPSPPPPPPPPPYPHPIPNYPSTFSYLLFHSPILLILLILILFLLLSSYNPLIPYFLLFLLVLLPHLTLLPPLILPHPFSDDTVSVCQLIDDACSVYKPPSELQLPPSASAASTSSSASTQGRNLL